MAGTRKAPKKNIGSRMADIRHPETNELVEVRREGSLSSSLGASEGLGEEREEAVAKMFEKRFGAPGVLDGALSSNRSGRSGHERSSRFFITLFLVSIVLLGGGFYLFHLYSLRLQSLRAAVGSFGEFQSVFTISGGTGGSPESLGSGGGSGILGSGESDSFSNRLQEIFLLS